MQSLEGTVAIISGAAQGLGEAIVNVLVSRGAQVIAGDVRTVGAEHAAVHCVELDVTSERDWTRVVEDGISRFGHIDALVNNAGVSDYGYLDSLPLDEWNRVLGVNQTGTFLGMKAVIPSMIRQNRGAIVNISSICGSIAVTASPAYHATKHAIITMTKNAAVTYARDGIRANVVQPGWFPTPLTLAQSKTANDLFISRTPMGRGGDPGDVGNAVAFFISDDANYITGVELPVDGGYLAQ